MEEARLGRWNTPVRLTLLSGMFVEMEEARLGRWNTHIHAVLFPTYQVVEMEEARLGRWNKRQRLPNKLERGLGRNGRSPFRALKRL